MSQFFSSSWGSGPMSENESLFWRWNDVIEYFENTDRSPDVVIEFFRYLDGPLRNILVTTSTSPQKSAAPFRFHKLSDEGSSFAGNDYFDPNDYFRQIEDDELREYLENQSKPKDTSIQMSTINGRIKFKYEGSIKEGTRIFYGMSNNSKFVSKETYKELLKTFSRQTIQLDYPPKDTETPNNLLYWLYAHGYIRLLGKYIASILIKEGYAKLCENTTNTIRILK